MHRVGIVDQVDGCRAKVRFPDLDNLLSSWLQVMQHGSAGRRGNWRPERGEQVLCLVDDQGDTGFILGGLYTSSQQPPAGGDQVVFDDGTKMSYDRQAKKLQVACAGAVEIVVSAGATVMIGAAGLTPADGAVTRRCLCAYTGAPHPDASAIVLLQKGGA